MDIGLFAIADVIDKREVASHVRLKASLAVQVNPNRTIKRLGIRRGRRGLSVEERRNSQAGDDQEEREESGRWDPATGIHERREGVEKMPIRG
jgi:hypothetical protein